jgi:serine/threonine-protein kinase
MPDDLRVRHLVEEILDTERTPEEVCSDTPDLLPAVRKRLAQIEKLGLQLDKMFPTEGPTNRQGAARAKADIELPTISGYEVKEILGRGGIGVVFKARQLKLNRIVALKMLLAGAYAGPEELARFRREAEAVAALRHPNIVQVYDADELTGRPFFTMEYVEGGTLEHRLAGKPQPPAQAAQLVATLAAAVQFAHQSGIIHRDLKPVNILLTADGTPKISDFGLARRLEGAADLTRTGAPMGTPGYMPPEQALGSRALGPSADIYALGAILYELLTGRPPFHGETAGETVQQVLSQEPVPPSRLNFKVPRDLETICLKCLAKEPDKRYPSALALAADLERFQRGEPIAARRPGLAERLGKWVRRRPATAGLIGATALFTIALIVGALWFVVQQAKRREVIEGELRKVADQQRQARWTDATETLRRAEARLNGGGPSDLRQRIKQAWRDLDLVIELDRIRLSRLTSGKLVFYKTKADRDYRKAFEEAGLAKVHDPPDAVAARVHASAVSVALMAALDDWAVCATDKDQRDWLLAVARKADPDPEGWRDRIRAPATWEDPAALADLAAVAPLSGPSVSVPLLLAFAERLGAAGGDMPAFLKRVQNEHPADFWANLVLGDTLLGTTPLEAGGYYRAALASRPDVAVVYTSLGDALRGQKLHDQAVGYYRRALEIDQRYARGHTNLGNILNDAGQTEEAIACFRSALEVDPNYAWAHFDLANTLRSSGRMDEAVEHYRKFNALEPTNPYVAHLVRGDLVRRGRGEELLRDWTKTLEAKPPEHLAWFGYAELCLFLGHEEDYRQARRDLVRLFGATDDPFVAEQTSRSILLMPATGEELQTAALLAGRAVAAKEQTDLWIYPYFLFAQGLAEYRQGRFDSAIATMTKSRAAEVMGPCPRFVLAMAQHRKGQTEEARKTISAAIVAYDWSLARALSRDDWIWHVLRREAETIVFPDTTAFLEGNHQPRDNIERLALLGVCRFKNLNRASAQLYADAFAADPTLVDDPRLNHRYKAACAAALAGSGVGANAEKLDEAEKLRWRKQACEWLAGELEAAGKRMQGATVESRYQLIGILKRWQTNTDLAGLREPSALAAMSPAERQECSKLWRELENLVSRAHN